MFDLNNHRLYQRATFCAAQESAHVSDTKNILKNILRQKLAEKLINVEAEFENVAGVDAVSVEGYFFNRKELNEFVQWIEHKSLRNTTTTGQ